MGNKAIISIISLYNWDNTLFDDVIDNLPTTVTNPQISITPEPLDGETLIGNIMFACGELSIIYHRPETLKFYLKLWAKKNKGVWQRLFDTLYYDYDPLFARVREYQLNRSNNLTRNTTDSEAENKTYNRAQNDGSQNNITRNDSYVDDITNTRTIGNTDTTTSSNSAETINAKQAFDNIGNWSNDSKSNTTESDSATTTTSGSISDVGQTDHSGQDNELTMYEATKQIADTASRSLSKNGTLTDAGQLADIITEKITGQRAYQELIDLQRRLAMFNLYDFIVDQFKSEFCIMVY